MNDIIILGITAYYHDSSAAILKNDHLIAAAQEERFTRKKNDAVFPWNAIIYCLSEADVLLTEIDYIVFYDQPILKFDRIISSGYAGFPKNILFSAKILPNWVRHKLHVRKNIYNALKGLCKNSRLNPFPKIIFCSHHESHAASAFYPSPFKRAIILCVDGVGEWDTTSVWVGENEKLVKQFHIKYPHSLGLLYSTFTDFLGFKVNSGEYKVMGLAPYGKPRYAKVILDNLINVRPDGSFELNMKYFAYQNNYKMYNKKLIKLLGILPRQKESTLSQEYFDLASSIQYVLEFVLVKMTTYLFQKYNISNLCLAGGVALNCVANSKIFEKSGFSNIWVQPAAGDAGNAVGACYRTWHYFLNQPRQVDLKKDRMNNTYLGPKFDDDEVYNILSELGAVYERLDFDKLVKQVAILLKENNVIGWFQGRMEFGPRALGNRSILASPLDKDMQTTLNLKIKFRESFRPFAPVVKADKCGNYFEFNRSSPYMLFVANVIGVNNSNYDSTEEYRLTNLIDRLKNIKSSLPAITHIDGTARIQTVSKDSNNKLYRLLDEFESISGVPVLVNTSFNIRGEPIVCTPGDAYNCFMHTGMDYLVIGNYLLNKKHQSNDDVLNHTWRKQFALD